MVRWWETAKGETVKVEPIISNRLKQFRETYGLTTYPDGEAFERFVNHAILSTHQPDAFSTDTELLDSACVGGMNDMGIDGIGVKVNGLFVQSVQDAQDLLAQFKRAQVEFIFIQSKLTPKFDSGEFGKFVAGVRDFLSEGHKQPMNEKIKEALRIKDYLLSEDVVIVWENNPSVRLYYVAMGKWRDSEHLVVLGAT